MATEQGSFEREALLDRSGAYKGIASRVEKLVPSDGVVPELIGQSGTRYTVEQTTTSKGRGYSFDSKTIKIHTETGEHWELSRGTGTDDESLTDGLVYLRYEGEERVELGIWNHGEYWRNRINVNVFRKFDDLFRDLGILQEGASPRPKEDEIGSPDNPEFEVGVNTFDAADPDSTFSVTVHRTDAGSVGNVWHTFRGESSKITPECEFTLEPSAGMLLSTIMQLKLMVSAGPLDPRVMTGSQLRLKLACSALEGLALQVLNDPDKKRIVVTTP